MAVSIEFILRTDHLGVNGEIELAKMLEDELRSESPSDLAGGTTKRRTWS
jgi:hypothetical protein